MTWREDDGAVPPVRAPMSRAEQHIREVEAAKLVARWFGTNIGTLESFTVVIDPVTDSPVATATLRTALTPEELAQYQAVVHGGGA